MFGVFIATSFLVKEKFTPIKKENMKPMQALMGQIDNRQLIVVMFITTMLVQSSVMSINPIVSLYVKEMMHDTGNIAFVAGIVAATPGLGNLVAASKVGHTMDRIGPKKVLTTGLIVAAVLFIPMTLTNSPWMLAFWRFLLGFANAALMPAAQTILTLEVPTEAFGRIFSYNQSFQLPALSWARCLAQPSLACSAIQPSLPLPAVPCCWTFAGLSDTAPR